MNQKGFTPILILIVGVLVVLMGGYWFFNNQYKSGNTDSNQSTLLTNKTELKVKENKNFKRLKTKEELEEYVKLSDQLKKYNNSRMIFTTGSPSTDSKWWGHWNITESDLKNKKITLNPSYQNQVINGLKNFSIILNGYESIDLNKNRVFLGVSTRFVEIFESLVIKANTEISSGRNWFNLSEPEKSAFLLANPSRDAKVLKDRKYLDAFKIVKAYILKQNEQNVNEIISICNSAKFEIVKYECYFLVSAEYIDDFDCDLIPNEKIEDRKTCFAWRGVYNQDKNYCKLAESSWCESHVYTTD